jgi:exopolysaccharide biosynthesis protein
VYTQTRKLADNLVFSDTVSWDDGVGRQEGFALTLTGPGEVSPIIMADDTVYGSLTISQMTQYAASSGYNVIAAVNTDFFSTQTGVPIGVAVQDGEYISSPGPAPFSTVSIGEDGGVHISKDVSVTINLFNGGSEKNQDNAGKSAQLVNFNKYRHDAGGLYMFSSAFSTVSTRTSSPGWFVKFQILEGRPTVSGEMSLMVVGKQETAGAAEIGEGFLMLSAAASAGYGAVYESFVYGDIVTMTTQCSDEYLASARWATGGGDILVSGGAVADSASWAKELLGKHPRTALGVRRDGSMLIYVLDGRNSTHSEGLTLEALAAEMLSQGCVDAVNLDGGGSSAMSVRLPGSAECAVVSMPSDGTERKCSTYMLFVTDNIQDGAPKRLALRNNGEVVLAGSSFDLTYAAVDAGFMPTAVPPDIAAVSGGLGSVDGQRYTAGGGTGIDAVALSAPSWGASGEGEVFIITTPTSLAVNRRGGYGGLTGLFVRPGESVELIPSCTYYRLSVVSQPGSFTYAAEGDFGFVDAQGVFTAADIVSGSGTITVWAGEKYVSIPVDLRGFDDVSEHWAKQYIYALAAKNIVAGVTEETFSPDSTMKRGEFVLMLYRAVGSPAVDGFVPADDENGPMPVGGFADVYSGDYYAKAVVWAKNAGITQGVGDGLFAPQSVLTRQEAFTLVRRALDMLIAEDTDALPEGDLTLFVDAADIAEYAQAPSAALVGMGIIEGSDGALDPKGELTRAQMAKILESVLSYSPPAEQEPELEPEPVRDTEPGQEQQEQSIK